MVIVFVKMESLPAKRKELLQTLGSIVEQVRNTRGSQKAGVYQDVEDENQLLLMEEWTTQEDADTHLASDIFTILRGTGCLMIQPPEIVLQTGEQVTPFMTRV